MSTKHLAKYIEEANSWNILSGRAVEFDLNKLDQIMAQRLFDNLDGDLSPENLCCDGELPMRQVRAKQRMLYGAANELITLGYTSSCKYSEFSVARMGD